MLDVLHITEACGGGVRRHLELILPALKKLGIHCGLLAFGARFEDGFRSSMEALGIPVRFCPAPSRLVALCTVRQAIRECVAQWQPCCLHLHAFLAGLAGRFPGAPPAVYSPHAFGIHPPVSYPLRKAVALAENFLSRRTSAWAMVGTAEMEDGRKLGLPPEKLHLIPNGLPSTFPNQLLTRAEARSRLGLPPEASIGAAPCRLAPQKGLSTLLDAIPRMPAGIQVLLAGDGPLLPSLQKQAKQLGITGQVLMPGRIPDFFRFLNAFDFIVLPSFYEGLSYTLLEGLAAAVPVVASDIPANLPTPDFHRHLHLFSPGNPTLLAQAIQKALQDKSAPFLPYSLETQAQKLAQLYLACKKS